MLKTSFRKYNLPENNGRPLLYKVTGFLCITAFAFFVSCDGNGGSDDTDDGYNREALLEMYSGFIQNEYASLASDLDAFNLALESFENSPEETTLNNLQNTFNKAYEQWQKVDFLNIESAKTNYFIESANTFPANVETIAKNISEEITNLDPISQFAAQGFPAIGYMLYHKEQAEAVTYLSEPKAAAYLRLLTERLRNKLGLTQDGWSSGESDFIKDAGSDAGSSISTLFNAFVESFEQRSRDAKVGIPAGIRTDNVVQPEQVEALYSAQSLVLLRENITGLKDFFNGSDLDGFDDYLDYLDAKRNDELLSDVINDQFDAVLEKIDALDQDIKSIVESDKAKAIEIFNEMQKMVVYLKVDMAAELGILINYADNDGDS